MLKNPLNIFLIALLATCNACKSTPKKGEAPSDVGIHQLYPYNIHIRRADVKPADPEAWKGDRDYESNPPSDSQFNCRPLRSLYDPERLSKIRKCLGSSKKTQTVSYRLRRELNPYLELLDPDEAPPCMKQVLDRISVPREIYFQSSEEGAMQCYSASIDLHVGEMLGVRLPFKKTDVLVAFPFSQVPKNDEETLLLLSTWSISPFFQEAQREIVARPFPRNLCQKCLGKDSFLDEDKTGFPMWPKE